MSRNKQKSFYLFARPSFLSGMARIFDLGGTLRTYNESENERDADLKAIRKDWEAVGGDIIISAKKYERATKGTFVYGSQSRRKERENREGKEAFDKK